MQMRGIGFWKIAAGFALAGALISGVWSLMVPDRYVSSAVLRIEDPAAHGALIARPMVERLRALQQTVFARQSLANIIQRQGLYERERAKDPLEEIVLKMRNRDLRVMPLNDSQFTVSFASDNPAAARATVSAIVAALAEANVKVQPQRALNLEVLDPPSLPGRTGPDRGRMIRSGLLAGLGLGIVCGALWSMVRGRRQWSWIHISGFAAAGMAIGITMAVLLPDEYVSTAVLRAADGEKMQAALQAAFSDASLSDVIERNQLYRSDRRWGTIEPVIGRMRNRAIRVQAVTLADGRTRAFTLSFQYTDRYKTQAATRDLVSRIVAGMPAEVLDPPSMPAAPSSPNRLLIIAFGVVAGMVLGMAASRYRRTTPAAAV